MHYRMIALAFLLSTSPALASGAYVSGYGGFNWDSTTQAKFVKNNTGEVVGMTIGKDVPGVNGLRVELDLSNRQNETDLFKFVKVNHEVTALMGNVLYDIPVDFVVKPYVMAGVGYAQNSANVEGLDLLSLSKSGAAWQVGAGVNYQLSAGTKVGLGYRYMDTPDLSVLGFKLSDGTSSSVVAQVSFDLN